MTQITTTTQPGDIVVIVPRWIIRAVGFLSLFIGLSTSFMAVLIGYITEGVLLALIMLALVPIGLLIQYVVWRFYWYFILITLIFQSLCYVLSLIGVTGFMTRMPASVDNSPIGSTVAALGDINPAGAMIGFVLAALITATLWRVYGLWQGGAPATQSDSPPADDFDFKPDPVESPIAESSLIDKVLVKLEKTGSRGEIKGDTIYVYKGGKHIGIVRVIDRAAAISPILVKDVLSQRNRLGVDTAYLATSGTFTDETRGLANTWGIKLMTV